MFENLADNILDELIKIRRTLHSIPELANKEFETSEYIINYLNNLGIENYRLLETGVVALIRGKKGAGKTLLVRADIDALPIFEKNEVSYKSKNIGVMHACGHDAHIACALGLCLLLKKIDFDFYGNIKVVFQPAEEDDGGAKRMIDRGVMNSPDVNAAIAMHVDPMCTTGNIQYRNGTIMASPDDFKISIRGIGGHGACPENCINPIYAATNLISKLSAVVDDNFKDKSECVVSVCTINGGTFNNIIPETVEITGTARSLSNDTRDKIDNIIYSYVKDTCKEYNCKYEYIFNRQYPPVINDEKMNRILIDVSENNKNIKCIENLEKSCMTGDDFSYFSQIVPSVYFKLGAGNKEINKPLHSPEFNIDENCLTIGAQILADFSLKYLNDLQ